MSVVIKNYLGEIVCVNKYDELRCKQVADLVPTDRIVFRVLDMRETSNAASVHYGDPIWIKVSEDILMQFPSDHHLSEEDLRPNGSIAAGGRIVGAKLFHPPEVKSMQKEFTSMSMNKLSSLADEEQRQRNRMDHKESNNDAATPSNDAMGNSLSTHAKDIVGHACLMNMLDKTVLKESGLSDDYLGMSGLFNDFNANLDDVASRYHSRQSTILGKWIVNPAAMNMSKDTNQTNGNMRNNSKKDATSSFHSNSQSMYENSDHHHVSRTQRLCSMQSFYFEQDLYCLSVAGNEIYCDWPKISLDFVDDISIFQSRKKNNSMASISEATEKASSAEKAKSPTRKSQGNSLSNDSESLSSQQTSFESFNTNKFNQRMKKITELAALNQENDHQYLSMSHSFSRSQSTRLQSKSINKLSDETSSHVVLKKILYNPHINTRLRMKSSDHDENNSKSHGNGDFLIERRSIFQFFLVENSTFMKDSKSQENVRKLMDRARSVLKRSESHRKGHREYNYHGKVVYGGEGFIKSLKTLFLKNSFEKENDLLDLRRQKEVHLSQYFQELMVSSSDLFDRPNDRVSNESIASTRNSQRCDYHLGRRIPSIVNHHKKLFSSKYTCNSLNQSNCEENQSQQSIDPFDPSIMADSIDEIAAMGTQLEEDSLFGMTSSSNQSKKIDLKGKYSQSRKQKPFRPLASLPRRQTKADPGPDPDPGPLESMEWNRSGLKRFNSLLVLQPQQEVSSNGSCEEAKNEEVASLHRRDSMAFKSQEKDISELQSTYHSLTPGEQIIVFTKNLEAASIKARVSHGYDDARDSDDCNLFCILLIGKSSPSCRSTKSQWEFELNDRQ